MYNHLMFFDFLIYIYISRALADQLHGDQKLHQDARSQVTAHIEKNKDLYAPFIDDSETFEKYLNRMKRPGTYGSNLELVAFARCYNVDIAVHQEGSPMWIINGSMEDDDDNNKKEVQSSSSPRKCLHVIYHSYEHYSSVRSLGIPIETSLDTSSIPSKNRNLKKKALKVKDGVSVSVINEKLNKEKTNQVNDEIEANKSREMLLTTIIAPENSEKTSHHENDLNENIFDGIDSSNNHKKSEKSSIKVQENEVKLENFDYSEIIQLQQTKLSADLSKEDHCDTLTKVNERNTVLYDNNSNSSIKTNLASPVMDEISEIHNQGIAKKKTIETMKSTKKLSVRERKELSKKMQKELRKAKKLERIHGKNIGNPSPKENQNRIDSDISIIMDGLKVINI